MMISNYRELDNLLRNVLLPPEITFYNYEIYCDNCQKYCKKILYEIRSASGGVMTCGICYLIKNGEDKSFIYVEPIEFHFFGDFEESKYEERLQYKLNLFLERLKNGTAKKVLTNGNDLGRDDDKIWKIELSRKMQSQIKSH